MLPQDDDEFEGVQTNLIPRKGSLINGGVLAIARARLSGMILAGDTAQHGAFDITHAGTRYTVRYRQEPFGGYKLIFEGAPNCLDRLPGFTYYTGSGTDYYVSYRDGAPEKVTPVDGRPRPDPDNATAKKTKFLRIPTKMRDMKPAKYRPSQDLIVPSMFTGQMREAAQCIAMRGFDIPFGFSHTMTHGIVEAPNPRVVGDDASDERSKHSKRKFWLVEISPNGVFATRVKNTKRCCDSFLPAWTKTTSDAITFMPLWKRFQDVPEQTNVKRLLTADDVAPAYYNPAKVPISGYSGNLFYDPERFIGPPVKQCELPGDDFLFHFSYLNDASQFEWTGWAFSYSGHEAQNVVFRAPFTGFTARAWRFKIAFTAIVEPENITAVFTTEDDNIYMLEGFNRFAFRGQAVGVALKLSQNGKRLLYNMPHSRPNPLGPFLPPDPGDPPTTVAPYKWPLYVFYDGDEARVVTAEITNPAPSVSINTFDVTGAFTKELITDSSHFTDLAIIVPFLDREAIAAQWDVFVQVGPDFVVDETGGQLIIRSESLDFPLTYMDDPEAGVRANPTYAALNPPLFVMGAGLYYDDPSQTTPLAPPDKTDKVLIEFSLYDVTGLWSTEAEVPADFTKPDQYPGAWIGKV